jgi:hypothetical protein
MIHHYAQTLMEIKEKILLFIEIGPEIGLLCHIEFHHFLLHSNGALHVIYQLEGIMMEMDEVIEIKKVSVFIDLNVFQ